MRRMTYFVMALAMVLGLAQCKKEQPTPQTQGVRITLTVDGGNSNSRVIVDPTGHTDPDYATVTFETGDVIYVGYKNAYVGSLTYSGGTFSGSVDISESDYGEKLHFYFLGGVGFIPTVDGNTATVVISDQSSRYPVISYSPSKESFAGEGSYSAKLQNKVSIMKFDVTTPSSAAICITGMNNKVTLNFNPETEGTDEGFTYGINTEDGGLIKMPAKDESNETWAIVLPQEALEAGEENSAYTADLRYLGTRPAMEEIEMNTFLNLGLDLSVGTANPHFKDLSLLQEDLTAQDGDILSGIINGDYKISVAANATVTLHDVTISYTTAGDHDAWAGITCEGNATILLSGDNTVSSRPVDLDYSGAVHPGIYIPKDYTLTIDGTGSLFASSLTDNIGTGGAAGIGGMANSNYKCGSIVINGGTITATGSAAGIGAGISNGCGTITINGGTVTATGGNGSAGIGAAGMTNRTMNGSPCGDILITGGTVVATGGTNGTTNGGAGIGAGCATGAASKVTSTVASITITGGNVTATGGANAAGIGTGYAKQMRYQGKSGCGTITISGGTVVAMGGETKGAGIGTGDKGTGMATNTCGAINITTGVASVTATKGVDATHSIGKGGSNTTCGTVTIGCTLDGDGNPIGGTEGYIEDSPYTYQP